jgi:hypothetical protein
MANLKRTAVGGESRGPQPWQYTHTETWVADDAITNDDLEQLKKKHYNMFPVVGVRFEIGPDSKTVTATVIEDDCS